MSTAPSCQTTCPYCGVGCGVGIHETKGIPAAVKGLTLHPANQGRLCVKGNALLEAHTQEGRLLQPAVHGRDVSWEFAARTVADRLQQTIDAHGPGSVALYLSGQLLTEDYYVANKLTKGFLGSPHVDTNSRLCMASTVAAYKRAFGEDVVPCQYEDIELANLVVLVGSNAAWTHPVVYQRLQASKAANPDKKIVVIDPRRTSTCDIADLHLPLQPGSDVSLFNGLLSFLVSQNLIDQNYVEAHTEGFADCLAVLPDNWREASRATGIQASSLETFYRWFAETNEVVTLFSQGVNQASDGTNKASSIIHAHLATGKLGAPGKGPFSLTGQPNAMGGREVGGMANQLAAHMDYSPETVAAVGAFWRSPAMNQAPGYKAVDMFDAVARGEIKAIWIMGTNPVVSMPDANAVKAALENCPTVIVSDCIANTDTTAFADILLPAAAWGEKDGTVTNSERCISRQRKFMPPAGAARPDWMILRDVAQAMGHEANFDYRCARDIFAEHARLTGVLNQGQRLFNISSLAQISASDYDALAPFCWPANQRPFANGRFSTPSGKAKFVPTPAASPVQQATVQHTLIMNTGRLRDQWHTMTRTGLAAGLASHSPEPVMQVHPLDAKKLGIHSGALVEASNDRGFCRMLANLTEDVPQGTVFAPIHWSRQYAEPTNVSDLFAPVVDPVSGQPESKHAAVSLQPVAMPYWCRLVSLQETDLPDLRQKAGFWFRRNLARGNCMEFALEADPLTDNFFNSADLMLVDTAAQQHHVRLGNTDATGGWMACISTRRDDLLSVDQLLGLLHKAGQPWQRASMQGAPPVDDSPLVCSCFEIRYSQIAAAILDGATTTRELGEQLSCGTNCGSCLPELNQCINLTLTRIQEPQNKKHRKAI